MQELFVSPVLFEHDGQSQRYSGENTRVAAADLVGSIRSEEADCLHLS